MGSAFPSPRATSASDGAEVCIELASNPAYLCSVRSMMGVVCRRIGFSDAATSKVVLAVDEALANVMKHGYERRLDGRIWLRAGRDTCCDGEGIRVVIEDEGRQVDPCNIKSRDLEDIRPGGLGVHIIREIMDDVRYECRDGKGMRLTLFKRLDQGARGPSATGGCLG